MFTELDDDVQYNGLWSARSFSQAWYNFKERRRATSVALHANLTYITLPWHRIIAGESSFEQTMSSVLSLKESSHHI